MNRRRRASGAVLVVLGALAGGGGSPAGAVSLPERTFLVSEGRSGSAAGGASTRPSITPGGRLIAFESTAPDLTDDPNGTVRDVFLRDTRTGSTRLISAPPEGGGADGPSESAVPAGDGDLVAFVSAASNLVGGDDNARRDVFVRAGLEPPVRVSVPASGEANGDSFAPAISRTGQTVVFMSRATNLVGRDGNGTTDVFAVDVATRRVRRLSSTPGGRAADGASGTPSISPDGRYVSFASAASNLIARDRNGVPDVFVHDLRRGRVERVSVSSGERPQNRAVMAPFTQVSDVSAGGRYVVFDSDATNLVPRDRNRDTDVFVRDRSRGTTRRVSVSSTHREGSNDSFAPTLSSSGRFVTFESFADDLAPGDAPREDVFIRDVRRDTTVVVDVTARGARPRGPERVPQHLQRPVLSDDGRLVAFSSTADNLAGSDANRAEDVFVRDLSAPRGRFTAPPRAVTRSRRPSFRLAADDPAAGPFLCSIDGRRRICGLRSRLPALRPGRHVLRASAGGPGMLYEDRVSIRRFRVLAGR
jgi:Tol biopolymer transport system component